MSYQVPKPSILAHPIFAFGGIWALTLTLFSLQMTTQLVPFSVSGFSMILVNLLVLVTASFFFAQLQTSRKGFDEFDLILLIRFSRILRSIWIVGTLLEIAVSGGVPLVWAIAGQSWRNYTDFGIPSFHGVMNAIYLQFMVAEFILWKVGGRAKSKRIYLIYMWWPIVMLGRGIFLSVLIQSLAVFLLFNQVRIATGIKIFVFAILNILLFGYLGNLRGTRNPFEYLISENGSWFFGWAPDGFLWVYIYVTSGVNNVFHNVDYIEPLWRFETSTANLLPSFVKQAFGLNVRNDILDFADSNLNVSTIYAGAISDFGVWGGYIGVSFILLIIGYVYTKARTYKLPAILAYSVLLQVMIFSCFYDMFLLLPTIFQLIVAMSFGLYRSQKRKALLETTAPKAAYSPT